ncbi:Y-family DNA polymerase [Leptospira interrogans]|uniref:Y-family DNA polymerase n=1 Tax=Leptospira interrogans TaxID=173 RepID=UPI0002B9E7F9|nr:Y-family DNA polymerase [Leptospira interrogans]QCO35764.1 Y-family DNA polymerase [Leptospira interrogans]UMQ52734.1 Y-family DNA polymerase [Leptospira interrogans]
MFVLVDCNSFYCSCERLFRPDLKNKPVVVLSNNDGCVISRSKEAKELGIKMGEPAFKRKEYFEENKIEVFSSNYALYGDISRRVMKELERYSDQIEIYSIDEAFLKLSQDRKEEISKIAKKIKKEINRNIGIPVSIGIGKTKSLAKIASQLAKKSKDNIYIILEEEREEALKKVEIKDVWGIGRSYEKLLKKVNVLTAFDYTQLNPYWIRKHLTVVGLRLQYELKGYQALDLEKDIKNKKTISIARSFSQTQTELEILESIVATFASRAAYKLRKQNGYTSLLRIFIHTNPFANKEETYSKHIEIKLPVPSQSTPEIVHYCLQGLRQIYKPKLKYKKAGVILDKITIEENFQPDLFDSVNREKEKRLNESIDKINEKFQNEKVKFAVTNNKNSWALKQERLSPRYTTRWEDIIYVLS